MLNHHERKRVEKKAREGGMAEWGLVPSSLRLNITDCQQSKVQFLPSAIYTLVFLAAALSVVTQRPSGGMVGWGGGGCHCMTTLKMAGRENKDIWVEFVVGSSLTPQIFLRVIPVFLPL